MPTDALDRITIRGFKSLASVDLKLRPLNVLIGANGSGKSNFIGAFAFLHMLSKGDISGGSGRSDLDEYVARSGGAEKLLHFGSRTTREIRFQLYFQKHGRSYEVGFVATSNDLLQPTGETITRKRVGTPPFENPSHVRFRSHVTKMLQQFRICHVHDTSWTSPMRKTAMINDNRMLRQDGSNLASFLYLLKEKHPASYELIRSNIQRVAPFFDDFALEPLSLNPDTIKLEWRHRHSDQYFDASSLSDGTLRFIALATLFLQPARFHPSLIIVDEPELGLHPFAIGLLASLMKLASRTTQVIVATQSAQLLDHFKPEDVVVASREHGATKLQRLDAKKLKVWLEEYSLGQLWEKNEFGGMPVVE